MAAIMTIFVTRISRLLGLTASAAVTATSAFGAAPSTGKLSTALAQPRQEHHSIAVPGGPRADSAAIEAVTALPGLVEKAVLQLPATVMEADASLALPEQRSMPGWLAARTAIDAKRNKARARNAKKQIPVRKSAAPKRQTKRVVWRQAG